MIASADFGLTPAKENRVHNEKQKNALTIKKKKLNMASQAIRGGGRCFHVVYIGSLCKCHQVRGEGKERKMVEEREGEGGGEGKGRERGVEDSGGEGEEGRKIKRGEKEREWNGIKRKRRGGRGSKRVMKGKRERERKGKRK